MANTRLVGSVSAAPVVAHLGALWRIDQPWVSSLSLSSSALNVPPAAQADARLFCQLSQENTWAAHIQDWWRAAVQGKKKSVHAFGISVRRTAGQSQKL